jgi:hypothetical protein
MTGQSLDSAILTSSGLGRTRTDSEVARALQIDDSATARLRSDSELARELQDNWARGDEPAVWPQSRANPIQDRSLLHRADSIADDSSAGVILFHFNGMSSAAHPPQLSSFIIHIRSSRAAVGQQISLDESSSSLGSFAAPIEEVVRTRWPGCKVDFAGQVPPSLD